MALKSIQQIKIVLLTECRVDYVGLWEAIVHAEHELKENDPQRIREVVMEVLGEMLCAGLIKAGDVNEIGQFLQWELKPADVIKRIDNEWDALGHEPNLGDIVWFTCP